MRSKMSLKKELASILDTAVISGSGKVGRTRYTANNHNIYVAERVNEYGYKCTYHFEGDYKEELLKRAASIQRGTPCKFQEWQNGNSTQKVMLFLKENKETLQVLSDIDYLMRNYKYDAQEACGILFKDKKKLPSCFRPDGKNGRSKTPVYRFDMSGYYGNRNIEYLIGIVRILPKSYLRGIDGSDDSNSADN